MVMRTFVLSALLNLLAVPASAQVSGPYGPKLQRIVQAYSDAGLFQGAVLVAMDDQVIYRDAFGLANAEWNIANTPETRFSIASLGKAFTAAIVLQLQEQGRLSVEDRVSKHLTGYLPQSATTLRFITCSATRRESLGRRTSGRRSNSCTGTNSRSSSN